MGLDVPDGGVMSWEIPFEQVVVPYEGYQY